jgi:catechol 2,3-dioxygenase-like lactoylglutathione lyase family enzyme
MLVAAMISAIESVTIGVHDLDAALAFYRDRLGYRVECDARAAVSLLAAWRLPVYSDLRLVTLSCEGHPYGRIRLAALAGGSTVATRLDAGPAAMDTPADAGPKAIDIYTGVPISTAIKQVSESGCQPRGDPQRFEIGPHDTEELLLTGPEGLPILLMVGHRHVSGTRRFEPRAGGYSEIATVSVVSADLDASRRFYEEGLGYVHETTDIELRGRDRDAACRLMDVPAGTRIHYALYREPRQPSGKVALLHFYETTTRKLQNPMRPGQLGISLFSCRCDDLEALATRLGRAGGKVSSVIQHVAIDNGLPSRVMLVRGPNEELFELVER